MEWISVKDKLPTDFGTYLVNLHQYNEISGEIGDFVTEATFYPNPLLSIDKMVGWHLLNEFYDLTEFLREYITHWMPWPEPPKFEDED